MSDALIIVLTSGLTLFITKLVEYIFRKRQHKAEGDQAKFEAGKKEVELIYDLRKSIAEIHIAYGKMLEEVIALRKENADLKFTLEALSNDNKKLLKELSEVKQQNEEMAKELTDLRQQLANIKTIRTK